MFFMVVTLSIAEPVKLNRELWMFKGIRFP